MGPFGEAGPSHMIPRSPNPITSNLPHPDSSKLWNRSSPGTRVLEAEIACQTL